MNLATFCRTKSEACPELDAFFASRQGFPFANTDASDARKSFGDIRKALADYAATLDGTHRHALFKEARFVVGELNRAYGFRPEIRYGLKESFLGDDEVNVLIMKLLHEAKTNDELAEELGCTPEAVRLRMMEFARGVRIGDMGVRFRTEPGKPMRSTVHPVLLPLNLSEVYLLLNALGEYAEGRNGFDPHHVVAESLAKRVYYQLSDYGKSRVRGSLEAKGLDFVMRGEEPVFGAETRVEDGQTGTFLQTRNNWLYHWKACTPFAVTYMSGEDDAVCIGALVDQSRLSTEKAETLFKGGDPTDFLVLRQEDGKLVAIHYGDIIDIAGV